MSAAPLIMADLVATRRDIKAEIDRFKNAPGRCDALRRKLITINELIAQTSEADLTTDEEKADAPAIIVIPVSEEELVT